MNAEVLLKSKNIYIYEEECPSVCLFVCLFAMHSVPVISTVTKLSMTLPRSRRRSTWSWGAKGCLSVRNEFNLGDSWHHQTFHGASLGPGKVDKGLKWVRVDLREIHPNYNKMELMVVLQWER